MFPTFDKINCPNSEVKQTCNLLSDEFVCAYVIILIFVFVSTNYCYDTADVTCSTEEFYCYSKLIN